MVTLSPTCKLVKDVLFDYQGPVLCRMLHEHCACRILLTPPQQVAAAPGASSPAHSRKQKDAEPEPEITPLQIMLQNAGPIRNDGSDKFFGLENVSSSRLACSQLANTS